MFVIFHCLWETIVICALLMTLDLEFPHMGNKFVVGSKGNAKS